MMQLAGCVIQNERKEILLLHRATAKRTEWELPGGKVEPHEAPRQTAVREVKEELGINVVVKSRIGDTLFTRSDSAFHYEWFKAEIAKGTLKIMEPLTHDQFSYFSVNQMEDLKLSANLVQLKQAILDGTVKL